MVFAGAIFVPNLKILTFSYSYSFLNLLALFLSIFLFMLSFFLLTFSTSSPYYGTFFHIFFNFKTAIVLLIVCLYTYHIDNMWTKFQYAVFFTGAQPPSSINRKDNSSFEEIRMEGSSWANTTKLNKAPTENTNPLRRR